MASAERGSAAADPRSDGELAARLERIRAEHERLVAELHASEGRFRALAQRVWRVQEEERRRLARELHDGVGQMLTALKNELDRLAEAAPDAAGAAQLASAASLAAEALDSTRELSRLLRPSVLDDFGLAPALRGLARSLGERAGFRVELRLVGELANLPPDVETLLFRIAQEALTNALKHSGATGAELELRCQDGRLRLLVVDRGRGCDPRAAARDPNAAATGMGLRSVRDRVESYGGAFRFESSPGAGARLTIELALAGGDP